MECVKLSAFIVYLENIYTESGDIDLYSWNGKVEDLNSFVHIDGKVILIEQKYIQTEDGQYAITINAPCIKLSAFIKHLENVCTENGDLDLHSEHGGVEDLETFIQSDEQLILLDQQGIDTED